MKTGSSLHKRIVETNPEIIPAARAGRCKEPEMRLYFGSKRSPSDYKRVIPTAVRWQ